MKIFLARLAGLCVLWTSVSCFAAVDIAGQMQQAQAFMQQGKLQEAYAVLEPLEFAQAGNIEFDYLLGVAALSVGKPERATIALERAVAVNPNYGDVRLRLAIAYYSSGDMERARPLFATVQEQGQTAGEKTNATQYLAAIKQQDDARELEEKKAHQPYLLGSLEYGLGSDNNIASTARDYARVYKDSLVGPLFSVPIPIPSGISDRFSMLNGNIEGRVPLANAGTYGYVSFDSANRVYSANSVMNSYTNVVKGGVNLQSGLHTYRFDLSRREYRQLGATAGVTSNSTQFSVAGDARFTLGDRDYLALSLQYNTPRYPSSDTQDTNQIVVGTNYTHIFPATGSPMIYLALNHTRDKAVRESVRLDNFALMTDVSRISNALIAYTQYTVVESADITAMWMTSRRNDSKPFVRSDVQEYGKDDMRVMMLGVNWRPAKDWTVKPQLMKIRNMSNIPLYAFQKTEVTVSVKREFK